MDEAPALVHVEFTQPIFDRALAEDLKHFLHLRHLFGNVHMDGRIRPQGCDRANLLDGCSTQGMGRKAKSCIREKPGKVPLSTFYQPCKIIHSITEAQL